MADWLALVAPANVKLVKLYALDEAEAEAGAELEAAAEEVGAGLEDEVLSMIVDRPTMIDPVYELALDDSVAKLLLFDAVGDITVSETLPVLDWVIAPDSIAEDEEDEAYGCVLKVPDDVFGLYGIGETVTVGIPPDEAVEAADEGAVAETTLDGTPPVDAIDEELGVELLIALATLVAVLLEPYVGSTMLDGKLPVDATDEELVDDEPLTALASLIAELLELYVGSTMLEGRLPVDASEEALIEELAAEPSALKLKLVGEYVGETTEEV